MIGVPILSELFGIRAAASRACGPDLEFLMKYVIPRSLETERSTLRMFRESDCRDLHEYLWRMYVIHERAAAERL
jgi:hypothetical protein